MSIRPLSASSTSSLPCLPVTVLIILPVEVVNSPPSVSLGLVVLVVVAIEGAAVVSGGMTMAGGGVTPVDITVVGIEPAAVVLMNPVLETADSVDVLVWSPLPVVVPSLVVAVCIISLLEVAVLLSCITGRAEEGEGEEVNGEV